MVGRVVHTRYLPVYVTTPAGTAINAAITTVVPITTPVELVDVRLTIPAGHAGLTGWRLAESGQAVIPWAQPADWIIGDDDVIPFDFGVEIGGGLQVVTYNLDIYPHTHYALLRVADLPDSTPDGVTLRPIVA